MAEAFHRFAQKTSQFTGSPWAFVTAVSVVVIWALTGPMFGFSETWQLVINTATTIVTFLMVFLIQNTQNRDSLALQLKLDELLRAIPAARTALVDLEELSEEELKSLQAEFRLLQKLVKRKGWENGEDVVASPETGVAVPTAQPDTAVPHER